MGKAWVSFLVALSPLYPPRPQASRVTLQNKSDRATPLLHPFLCGHHTWDKLPIPKDGIQSPSQPGPSFPFQACCFSPADCWMVPEHATCVHTSRLLLGQSLLPGMPSPTWPTPPCFLRPSTNVHSTLESFLSPPSFLKL